MKIKSFFLFLDKILINPLIVYQLLFPRNIPVVIINYNQLYYLKKLVNFCLSRKVKNIIIIDNCSTYQPLLDYYEEISGFVKVDRRSDNLGHMVFYKDLKYVKEYGKGFYFLTDADIVPNKFLPDNFIKVMISKLLKYYHLVDKVGFSLKIDDIPDYYPLKEKVLEWEQQFWEIELEEGVYLAAIDTTFALYKPLGRHKEYKKFYSGVRMGNNFLAQHGGWYINPFDLSDENKYYFKTSNSLSSSWKFDQNGEIVNDFFKDLYKGNHN